jgi:hypothetical protein
MQLAIFRKSKDLAISLPFHISSINKLFWSEYQDIDFYIIKINSNHIGRILRYIFSCQGLLPRRQRVLFFASQNRVEN